MLRLNKITVSIAAAALFLAATPVSARAESAPAAQAPDVAAQREAMRQLAFLHGAWIGATTTYRPDGSAVKSLSKDVVAPLMDGELLTISGSAYAPGATLSTPPVSQSYGIISFDERTSKLILTSFANGSRLRGDGQIVGPGHVECTMASPVGLLHFIMTAQGKDGWRETIDISGDDGKTWRKFVEIAFDRAR